jgi:type I protein arginine methyltransferase
MILLMDK